VKSSFFRLAEDRILVEQLRLLYGNLGSSVVPAVLLAILLTITLANDNNQHELLLWCTAVIASKAYTAIHARRMLMAGIPREKVRREVAGLGVMHLVYGAIWGTLAWITLDNTTVTGNILVLAVLAGVLGNTVALLSPVLPIFMSFMLAQTLVMGVHLWQMNDPNYDALLLASVLYLASLLGQARNSEMAARSAIELGFENAGLMQLANAAQRDAEQANQDKSKFLAAASHDLRQPIHAQGLFLEVLSRTDLTAYQNKVLASARSASLASSEMLNTLLDFSHIEAGVLKLRIKPFELQSLLNKIENDLAPQADAKGMVYRARDTTAVVNSDASLVEMILRNLVSNAIRYTDRGGVLTACRQRGDQAVVEVWDTGIGIDSAQQKDIFREFHQLGNPERDRRKGLGLGLAVAHGLAKLLGHELSLSSRPGRGSVFRLTLPLSSAAVIQNEPAYRHDAQSLRGMHVLVIDDDEAVLLGMAQLLYSWGCTVDMADCITQALARAQLQPPNVVISDYRLREQRTGAEAIAALRTLLGQGLPALLITGDTAPERLRDALTSGLPLLHKPVSTELLFQMLAEVTAQHRKAIAVHQA
jgi:signal transduction histidine kinase/ActR/RegA family two-component response regulator